MTGQTMLQVRLPTGERRVTRVTPEDLAAIEEVTGCRGERPKT